MVSQQFTFTIPDEVDLKSLDEIQIYHGFIVRLPFRLRAGVFLRLHISDSFDVIFRNRLDIPLGTPSDDVLKLMWEGKKFRPREQFYTEALILDTNPPMQPGFRDDFLRFLDSGGFQGRCRLKVKITPPYLS
jgi:hypothetical protein